MGKSILVSINYGGSFPLGSVIFQLVFFDAAQDS